MIIQNQNKTMATFRLNILLILFGLLVVRCSSDRLVGGWQERAITPENVALAEACVQELDAKSNSMYKNKLLTLKSVQTQVVSGIKYKFVFSMDETTCLKNEKQVNSEDCLPKNNVNECTVTLWSQPWVKRQQILDDTCVPQKKVVNTKQDLTMTGMEEKAIDSLQNEPKIAKEVVHIKRDHDLTMTGMEEKAVDSLQNEPKIAQEPRNKPLLGGGDHDVGNFGEFTNFKKSFNKTYSNKEEEQVRFEIFRENMKTVQLLNRHEKGSAKYGATEFADMSTEEFRKTHLTPKWDTSYDPEAKIADIPQETPPTNFDWRDHGAVTGVKNQGSCGSCWAFSTTGNVEGQWAIKKGSLLSLSEQELVDCDKKDQGCDGGLPVDAYKAIMKLGGLETETDYPYEGKDDACSFKKTEAKAQVTGYLNISSDEGDMAAWLAKNGPISIGINAMAMQFYFGGISHPWSFLCDPSSLDHGVLIVGYGVKKAAGIIFKEDEPYWIIKNSWGGSWGESGYYLVYRGSGVCGLNQMPTSAIVG